MKNSLYKDRVRAIGRSPNRFLSIFMIIAIGAAFFVGIKGAAPDMKATADKYYDDYNMMDIRVLSTMGMTDEDMTAISEIASVEKVQPSYFTDVVTTVNSVEMVFRIHALPAETIAAGSEDFINRPELVSGRYPQNSGECLIETSKNLDLGLRIGDTLTVSSGKKEDLSDVLKTTTFTIVGTAVSPYYLTYDKDASDIGSGKVNFFMMIPSTDFAYPVYTEALITVKGAKDLSSYSDEYQKLVEKTKSQLENLVAERSEARLVELKKQANEQLDEGKAQLRDGEVQFESETTLGQQKLDAAKNELVAGQATLDAERKSAATQFAQADDQIAQGEKDLANGQAQYNSSLAQYNSTKAQINDMLSSINEAQVALNDLDESMTSSIDAINYTLANGGLAPDAQSELRGSLVTLQNNRSSARSSVKQLNDAEATAKSTLASSKKQLDNAKAQLAQSRAELAQAKKDLAAAKKDAAAKFAKAEQDLADGNAEYDAAKADFDLQKADGQAQIDSAKEQVIRAESDIERLSRPTLYVLDRTKLYSYADYAATADRMDAIARLFPIFFFAVAALVCLTTMTRMVDEERGTIGTFKALGYTDPEIVLKYVTYAILASALGGILGVIVGINVLPEIIFNAWSIMYTLPAMSAVPQYALMAWTVLAGIAVTTVSAYTAASNSLQTTPSLLMRPKAPPAGKVIMMERINAIWSRMSFSQKVTARNIFRYKKRFIMTVVGIAGCAALLVAGFGLNDSIKRVVEMQYKQIFTYNMSVKFDPNAEATAMEATISELAGNPDIKSVLKATEMNATMSNGGEEVAVTLICPTDPKDFLDYVSLRDRVSQKPMSLTDSGMIINEKLAKELNISVGDAIAVDNGNGLLKKIEVAGITENYIFHYAYISPAYYKEIYRLGAEPNSLMIKLLNTSAELEDQLGTQLIGEEAITSVLYYSDAADKFHDTVTSLNIIVLAIIIAAGILAFVVLYNLTNINLGERIREIATIKVLGFYNNEVSAYVYRENIILSIIGAVLGLFIGIYLHRAIMTSIEQDGVMFGNYISSLSFLYAFAITFFFSILVNIFMYRRLKNIPMVESLKSVE